ncbi:little elongation complex subunit 2 [Periophthalmus magnuspinnatus]|uniref:little elongation complex subunit 2 n=1 Tax=Periophthalmus magnuspinnatus TaxID=409849 RepID=UPI00145A97A2|nr:little elongation complex subunit 2 [Periophthalmus magnuspinnatus]
MEIVWEDPPIPEGPIFSRDLYDKIGFGPTIQELWSSLQSPEANSPPKEQNTESPTTPEPVQDDSIREESSWISGDSEDSAMETQDPKLMEPCKKKQKGKIPFPEPRVPYPCLSALSKTEQRKCLNFMLTRKKEIPLSQVILNKLNNEIMQFMNYLQEVSRMCAGDYSVIPQAALQYFEEVFHCSLEYIQSLPSLYQIHELTSLTGGRFNPELSLTFEKQLLHMGSVDVAHYRPVNTGAQIASDYQTVSSLCPPAKKAAELHASISSDHNASRLCSSYEPHVCLTRDALVQLLNNHGPDFKEEWELPVLIKTNPSKDKTQKKTVFIDSPLLKTEVTVRERSHIYHEESLKLFISKASTKSVSEVITELPTSEQPALERSLAPLDTDSLDFEVDLSDLETFGENASNKTPKKHTKTEGSLGHTRSSGKKASRNLNEETNSSQSDPVKPKVSQSKSSDPESDSSVLLIADSDDDKLFIDDVSPKDPKLSQTPESPSPTTRRSKNPKMKTRSSGDQLGQILQMQTAMFTSNPNDGTKSSNPPQDASPPPKQSAPTHVHPTSMVKACVSSYLERNPNQEEETGDALQSAASAPKATEFKKILSQALQAVSEDECDYDCPEEGNVLFKLYSLDGLLLLVRSSISLGHNRKLGNQTQCVPLKILPKLEYQLTYGVECLSSSEACQLWTEGLLHSSTELFIAHIDALTSRLALVRKLPDDWIHNISCGFKPAKSLNILQHLLQKLVGLDEGQYLLRHKVGEPFVNILKTAQGNGRQGVYNLQQAHSHMPQPPAAPAAASAPAAVVPWIPLDPSVCLPFHRQHGRVPCTFPPQDFTPPQKGVTPPQPYNKRGGQPGGKKPKKKNTKNKYTPKFKR